MKKKDIKILLVDDEPDILEIVGYNLRQEGYQIFTAPNGKEAISAAKKILPQIIVLLRKHCPMLLTAPMPNKKWMCIYRQAEPLLQPK